MSAIDHLDLVVTSLKRSLAFYRGLLLGYVRVSEIEGEPREYAYTHGYYAVFLHGPDGLKLELVHRPSERDLVDEVRRLEAPLASLEQARA